ncbi:uncharacterized protein METZ01_LOCUS401010, partial [marine metagenome]
MQPKPAERRTEPIKNEPQYILGGNEWDVSQLIRRQDPVQQLIKPNGIVKHQR